MEVVKYNFEPELKQAFIDMNVRWIKRDYVLEKEDIRILNEIDDEVRKGAIIYFSLENGEAISTLCLTPLEKGTYELVKFATKEGKENRGAGRLVLDYALNDAKKFAKEIIIATNKKCYSAIHLYEKYGFIEYKTDNQYGFSESRVDICYKLTINK